LLFHPNLCPMCYLDRGQVRLPPQLSRKFLETLAPAHRYGKKACSTLAHMVT